MVVFTRSQTRSQTRSETRCTVVAGDEKQCTRPYEKEFYEYSETSLRLCSEHLKYMDELRQDRKSLETVTLNNTGPLTDDKIAIIKAYLIQRAASSSSSPGNPSTPANSDIPPKDSGKKRRAEEDPPRDTQTILKELNDAKEKVKQHEINLWNMRQGFTVYGLGLMDALNMEKRKSKVLNQNICSQKAEFEEKIHNLRNTISELTDELKKSEQTNQFHPNVRALNPDERQTLQKYNLPAES